MSYYTDKQYAEELPRNAKKDLNLLFFNSFLKDCERILDVGCSVGRIISLDPKRIEGIDIDKKALEIARSKGYKVRYGDVTKKLPFGDNAFDGIYCSHLIEHLENPLDLLKESRRILKRSGKLIVITPDYLISSHKRKDNFWDDYTHRRPFTQNTLKRIAYDAGFKKFRAYHFPGKGFRNLMRAGLLSKEQWIKLEKLPFIWKGQNLVLEIIK